jgi:hypothetical protein
MSSRQHRIPPFAGVCSPEEAQRTGISVNEASHRLRRFCLAMERLAFIATAHLNPTPEWEIKSALSLHAWLDAEHVTSLRERVTELRESNASLQHAADARLAALLEEALHARGSAELVTAVYGVLRPALADAMRRYLEDTNPLADQPSCRELKLILVEEEEAIAWGREALAALTSSAETRKQSEDFAVHLHAYLAAARGIDGTLPEPEHELPPPRAAEPFRPDVMPRRDERFNGLFDQTTPADTIYSDESRPIEERNLALLFKRLREMDVPEAIAGILAETPGKPWDFYHDMLREMWDEARHSLLGEAALEARGVQWTRLPVNVTFSYKLARFCTPLERHILLFAIEQSLMPSRRGKRWEWTIARESGDKLSTTFHDFDWADEVLHAAIGKKHLRGVFHGDFNAAFRHAEELAGRIAEGLERDPMPADAPPPDWWEKFASQVLGRKVDPAPKTSVKEWSPTTSASA